MKKLLLVMLSIIAPLSVISVVACKDKEEGSIRILRNTIATHLSTIHRQNDIIYDFNSQMEILQDSIDEFRDRTQSQNERIITLGNDVLFLEFQENVRLCSMLSAVLLATNNVATHQMPNGRIAMHKVLIEKTKAFYASSSSADKRQIANDFKTAFDSWILLNGKTAQVALIGKKMLYADTLLQVVNNLRIHVGIRNTAHKTRLEKDYNDNWAITKLIDNAEVQINNIITWLEDSIKTAQDYLDGLNT